MFTYLLTDLSEPRRDQEEGGELDPQQSPGEIKRREESWTLNRAQERSRGGRRAGPSTESRRDQEEGGELDPQQSPGEIKRREESWTLNRAQERSRGGRRAGPSTESRRDQEEGGELDPQQSPGEIKSREVELGSESWTTLCFSCSSTVVLRTLSL